MIDFEKEFRASERMRERIHEAEHERMARRRPGTRRNERPWRSRLAIAVGRHLARAADVA